jgi:hypothetical protein
MIREGAQALTAVIVLGYTFDGDLFLMAVIVWLSTALFLKATFPCSPRSPWLIVALLAPLAVLASSPYS